MTFTLTKPKSRFTALENFAQAALHNPAKTFQGATAMLLSAAFVMQMPQIELSSPFADMGSATETAQIEENTSEAAADPNFIPTPEHYEPREFRLPQYGDPAIYVNFPACPNKPYMAYQADQEVVPASLTKVMTLYLIAKALNDPASGLTETSQIPITQTAIDQSRGLAVYEGRFRSGDRHSLHVLVQAAGASSEATSTNALAIAYGRAYNWQGSDAEILTRFAGVMNATAHDLGMNQTTYANPTGNYGNRSTVRDTNILFNAFQNRMSEEMQMMLGNRSIDTGRLAGVKPASSRALRGMTRIDGEEINVRFAKTGALGGDYNEALTFITQDGSRATISMIGVHGSSGPNALDNRASAMRDIIEEVRSINVQTFCHS